MSPHPAQADPMGCCGRSCFLGPFMVASVVPAVTFGVYEAKISSLLRSAASPIDEVMLVQWIHRSREPINTDSASFVVTPTSGIQLVLWFWLPFCFPSQVHLIRVGSLSGQGAGPVSDELCGAVEVFTLVPLVFRPVGFRFSDHPVPLGSWDFITSGLPETDGPQRGFHVPLRQDAAGLGSLLTLGSVVSKPPSSEIERPHRAFQHETLPAADYIRHRRGLELAVRHRGSICIGPSSLPSPVAARRRGPLLGLTGSA